ncbi:ABC transporter ATP-binding protein [Motilimonas cestriensis]|uniref:ABC transporter ATP-binding protein n=1 Tax=Motilimonas cestriensis TaxID=2742685 RepID=UPI003DA2C6C2
MKDSVIEVNNLNKVYKLYPRPIDRFFEAISFSGKVRHQDFNALSDINFSIGKGQTVGILGKNGAGKSTLLKILTGVLTPSSGNVQVKGRISSLLELGAGFNPEYTGLENIFFQGTLLGYSKEEVELKLSAILDFADIGDFIHQPVRLYSSGMFARLAFSVAINVEPDVLMVDEALSVGDAGFQLKCMLKMQELQEKGVTILFVSHDTQSVIRFCQSVMIMQNGKLIEFSDDVITAAKNYEKKVRNLGSSEIVDKTKVVLQEQSYESELGDIKEVRFGSGTTKIASVEFYDSTGKKETHFEPGDDIVLRCLIDSSIVQKSAVLGFSLRNTKGVDVAGDNTLLAKGILDLDKGQYHIDFSFTLNIPSGDYFLYIGIASLDGERVELDQRWPLRKLVVSGGREVVGVAYCPSRVDIVKV